LSCSTSPIPISTPKARRRSPPPFSGFVHGIVIIVAHRPSALAATDHVLAMARGVQQAFDRRTTSWPAWSGASRPSPHHSRLFHGLTAWKRCPPHDEVSSIRHHVLGGLVIALTLTVGIGGWSATTELSGAVFAPGSIVVDSNVKKVQHLTGGIVGELLVREGRAFAAGGRAATRRNHHAGQSRDRHVGSRRDVRPPGPPRERARRHRRHRLPYDRSVMSYFTKPLPDQILRAFRER
jgi:hypothetical protein